ncbi:unnamed protein product [Lepeophtheirus salmonis]|uniref:(salmon louse) hypothetical protein n=1 Tax=Lepeophtheirus salmonis TaxID=72036 RepID=A0A7R8CYP6_LEPSM|nr:unnamed protein product [Lepeophtheirus salmonis]CAF2971008.1 unnamed protein product [Lepeophtheirus salmonis]
MLKKRYSLITIALARSQDSYEDYGLTGNESPEGPTISDQFSVTDPPIKEFPTTSTSPRFNFIDPFKERSRPQVDEFGNPIGEIHSVDTTKFELGEGIDFEEFQCPRNWVRYGSKCYKFTRSPLKRWSDARLICQAYRHKDEDSADLASINTLAEHRFIASHLNRIDPQHRRWYISARQESDNTWINQGDLTQMKNLQDYFIDSAEWGETSGNNYNKDYLVYEYSEKMGQWGFKPVFGDEEYLYICEMPIDQILDFMKWAPFSLNTQIKRFFDVGSRSVKNDISLLCIAHVTPNKKSTPLKDSRITISGGQLIINNPNSVTDRGKYFCQASNKFGTIRSRSVTIAFGFIGEFILRRNYETGDINWGKSISCDPPQYFPLVKFYWNRDYFPNYVEEDRRIMVSYDGNLYFSSVEKIDEGNYSCSVQSSVASSAPVAGQYVRMECISFGYPVAHYNWTRKGSDIPKDALVTNHNRVLIIPRVKVEDQGEYICRAYNDKLSISASTGDDKLAIEDRGRYEIKDNVLIIRQVSKRDQGMYECLAYNDLDARYSSGQLRVLSFSPSFDKYPLEEKLFAAEGGNITIKCKPEGAPTPEFVWRKNGAKIGSGGKYIIYKSGSLFIRRVNADDSAVFTCEASNEYGRAESTGRLIVKRGPSFQAGIKPKPLVIVNKGSSVNLKCKAVADPLLDMAYSWSLNNLKIRFSEDEENYRLLSLQNAEGQRIGGLSCSYTKGTGNFNKFRRGNRDGYLKIYNITVGRITAESQVIIHGPPGPPGSVSAVSLSSKSGTIIWTDGAIYGSQIKYYRIEGRTRDNSTFTTLKDYAEAQEITYLGRKPKVHGRRQYKIIDQLSPYSAYQFRVTAYNDLGLGEHSEPSPIYNTLPDKPTKNTNKYTRRRRTYERLDHKMGRTIEARSKWAWSFFTGYIIEELESILNGISNKKHLQTSEILIFTLLISKENIFFTTYEVKIQVFNDLCQEPKCEGPISDPVEIYSAEDLPQVAPTRVGARPFNSTAIRVTWLPISNNRDKIRGKLIGYRIKYWRRELEEISESQYLLSRSLDPEAFIIGLIPNTYYWVRVMAYNSAGPGPESERFLERTFKLRPQKPPTAVQVTGINPSTIRVTWRYVAPSVEEEPLTGYKSESGNLTPGKVYHLRVLAFSQGGEGKMSSPVWQFQMGDPDKLNG